MIFDGIESVLRRAGKMSAAAEAPAGEETVDTHTAGMDGQSETFVRRVYTAEQQARLKVDKHGKTTVEEPGGQNVIVSSLATFLFNCCSIESLF